MNLRAPAVAGTFYPADPALLAGMVDDLLAGARVTSGPPGPVRAYVVPHAGLVFSGPIAASAYAHLRRSGQLPGRVLLIGPSHRVALRGLAVSGADAFDTPLGSIPVDIELRERLLAAGLCVQDERPHAREHSLEVQLPFLRRILPEATLLPVVGGEAAPEAVADLFEAVWDDEDTLVLISSDLSHFLPYEEAVRIDEETALLLEALDGKALEPGRACGRVGLGGLVALARRRPLTLERLDLRNSGDTQGRLRAEVVGYGAWAVRDG
ncbi:MAG: AmmeMemoRadiSam system protein B [Deltaproteobacteria bacterium]|nr:AmmeMemoRadiSam system protein B [Deltaproteobacteria bacterium]